MAERTSRFGGWFRGLTPGGARERGGRTTELPERGNGASATEESKTTVSSAAEEKPTTPVKSATEEKAAPAPPAKPKPPPDTQARIDGLQGWAAEMERKQGRMTYFGAAAGVLALALAGAALYFAITAKNDTSSDIDLLRDDVNGIQQQVEESTSKQIKGLNGRISSLEQQVSTLSQRSNQTESDIAQLQSQGGGKNKKGATTPAVPGVPTTPLAPGTP